MIEQHYFTMSHKGISNKNTGYNTVANSRGLTENYLNNTIHNYCQSDFDLQNITSGRVYSYIYSGIHNGSLLVGKSNLPEAEIKNREIFTHNFIVSKDSAHYYLKHMKRIIYATGFEESYDIKKGKILPRKDEIPYAEIENTFEGPGDVFAAVGLQNENFVALINCIFSSAKNNKSVKIILELEDSEFEIFSKGLLLLIYRVLPIKLRESVGFIINPLSAKNMPGSFIIISKKSIENVIPIDEYTFIMENGHLKNDIFIYEDSEFVKFVCRSLNNVEVLVKLLSIGDSVIKEEVFSLAKYDKLIYFYNALSFLELASPKTVEDNSFIAEAQEKIMSLLRQEEDRYSSSDMIYAFLDYFAKEYPIEEYKGRYGFVSDVLKYDVYKYIFNTLDISTINRDNILKIHLREEEDDDEKYIIINTVQHIITASEDEVDKLKVLMSNLSKDLLYNINILVKDYYEANISRENYPFIILGFISGADEESRVVYNFEALLDYFTKIGGQVAASQVIKYLADEFKETKSREVYALFSDDAKKYFLIKQRDILKNQDANKILFSIENEQFLATLTLVKNELSTGIKKLIYMIKRIIT